MNYKTVKKENVSDGVAFLTLNRPDKLNAINVEMFKEIGEAVKSMDEDGNVSVVIFKGEGDNFSSGLDFFDLFLQLKSSKDFNLWNHIIFMQDAFLSIYKSKKIYIAAVDGYCLGAGLDLISACDLRIATNRSKFSIAETKLGIVADLGALQHLSRILSEQIVRYWAYTSRIFDSKEAYDAGLLLKICSSKEELMEASKNIAKEIISNPQKAILNTKKVINYSLYNTLEESLRFAGKQNLELDEKELLSRFQSGLKS